MNSLAAGIISGILVSAETAAMVKRLFQNGMALITRKPGPVVERIATGSTPGNDIGLLVPWPAT